MARFVQSVFGLNAPDERLRRSLQFAPLQTLVIIALLAFGIADPSSFGGFHAAWVGATAVLVPLQVVEYILRNRELAYRYHAAHEAAARVTVGDA